MAKYKYISFGNCCILIEEEYGKIEGREILISMECALIIKAVIRALLDLRLINNSMYGTMYNER